jgi:vacuolar-type H+-ATPase subunit F/Vma7
MNYSNVVTAVRRIIALAVLLTLVAIVARTYAFADAGVCRQAVGADKGIVTICGPIGPNDLPALAVALLVGLILLLPDLSELDIAGLVTLKRAVAEQQKQTDELRQTVQQLSVHQETNVTLVTTKDVSDATETVKRVDRAVMDKSVAPMLGVVPNGELAPQATVDAATTVAPSRAIDEAQVMRLWQRIESSIEVPSRDVASSPRQTIDTMGPAEQWLALFGHELGVFRAVRNTVAHRPDALTDEQLADGVKLGTSLTQSLDDWLTGRRRVLTR